MDLEQLILNDLHACKAKFPDLFDEELYAQLNIALHQFYHTKTSEENINTYLKDLGIPQIILFDILANRFPLVLSAQQLVQQKMAELSTGSSCITIIDLGIGRGIQIMRIVDELIANENKQITIIGIDIVKEALEFTENNLKEYVTKKGIQIHFHPILKPIEDIRFDEINKFIPDNNELTFVNASLALHHIQNIRQRENVFQIVKLLQPSLFSIIEPFADTFTSDRKERMLNSYVHFTSLYAYVNTLDLNDDEKKGLKTFFYNDFSDTIINSDTNRYEKYEPGKNWIERGLECGLKTFQVDCSNIKIKNIEIIENKDISSKESFISFRFKNWDVLSVLLFHN